MPSDILDLGVHGAGEADSKERKNRYPMPEIAFLSKGSIWHAWIILTKLLEKAADFCSCRMPCNSMTTWRV